MSEAFIVAARRTPVAPRNGAFARVEVADLGAPALLATLSDACVSPGDIDEVILGNALYGGGNPTRLVTLAAGLPEQIPALTIDTQCCAGLDAILLAAARIRAGEAHAILAGGVESYSRSALRARRPTRQGDAPVFYDRPPFSPWADRDPDLIDAAAALAKDRKITRAAQEWFAIASHAAALGGHGRGEIVPIEGTTDDTFKRTLTKQACARFPLIAGDEIHGLTATTTAVEADAAAVVLVVSAEMLDKLGSPYALRIGAARRVGVDPLQPAIAAQLAARPLLADVAVRPVAVELMESFAAQALAAIHDLGLEPSLVNRGGGALSRGHPIGASGAILAVRLFSEMRREARGSLGLAAIPAAGGLGTAALFERL